MLNSLLRFFHYIKRGYLYIGLLLTFWNFIVIQYRLFIDYIPFLKELFPNIFVFSFVSAIFLVVVLGLLGRWDFWRGGVAVEQVLHARNNPFIKETLQASILNSQAISFFIKGEKKEAIKKLNEAITILEKWK